jgi:PAS domain S-box-containing protein
VAIGMVLVVVALVGSAALLLGQRRVALDAARIAAENLALAIAEQTTRSMQAVDAVLLDLRDHATETDTTSAEAVRAIMAGPRFASWMRSSTLHLPQIESLLVTDAGGHVLSAAGRLAPPRQAEIGAEAARYFAAPPGPAAAAGDNLFISAPQPEPAAMAGRKPWLLYLARPVTLPDGTRAGNIVTVLRLDAFGSLYAGMRLHGEGLLALLRHDGEVLLRQPPLESGALRVSPDSPWHGAVARGGGSYRSPGIFDRRERIIAVRPLHDYDLVMVVGVDEAAALAGWRRDATLGGVGALAAAAAVLLLLRALLQQFRRLEQTQASLAAANEELSRKSRELETTLAYMDQGLIMVTPDNRVAVCNDRAIELLSLPPGLMRSRPRFETVLDWQWEADEFDCNDPAMQAMRQRGGYIDRPHSYERRRPNGQMIEVRSVPLDAGGVVRTYTDITARALGEERFRQIFNDSPLAIALAGGEDRRFVQVNPALCALVGRSAEDLVGRPWSEIVHPDDRAALLTRSVPLQGRVTLEVRLLTSADAVVWLRLTRSWLPAAPGLPPVLLAIGEDVTPQRDMQARLRQAQRLEAVGQLTGGVAHDFNNLLAIIVLDAELLAEALADDPEHGRLAAEIVATAGHGAELTRRLLAFARRQTLQPRAMDLNASITEAASLLRRTLGPAFQVELNLASGLWPLRADPSQVGDALLNLALNARDAMPDGGTLTIATANAPVAADAATPELPAGDYVSLTVADTGTGMTPEVLERAMEPFFTTKPPGAGTGLGLSMIYGFARQSGGTLVLDSAPGAGTTVRLLLPRAPAGTPAPVPEDRPEVLPVGSETVLLVDDNMAVRRVAARHLAALGYSVHEAENGPAALALLQSDTRVDLLFTDIIMPGGMTGVALAQAGRRLQPALKVLYTSGFARITEDGSEAEPTPLLRKPFRRRALATQVRAALDA